MTAYCGNCQTRLNPPTPCECESLHSFMNPVWMPESWPNNRAPVWFEVCPDETCEWVNVWSQLWLIVGAGWERPGYSRGSLDIVSISTFVPLDRVRSEISSQRAYCERVRDTEQGGQLAAATEALLEAA